MDEGHLGKSQFLLLFGVEQTEWRELTDAADVVSRQRPRGIGKTWVFHFERDWRLLVVVNGNERDPGPLQAFVANVALRTPGGNFDASLSQTFVPKTLEDRWKMAVDPDGLGFLTS